MAGPVNAPRPFALGDAPEPQKFPETVGESGATGSSTHTGTDPFGRAIGPAEDHTKPKLDLDGDTAGEAGQKSRRKAKR